MFKINSCPFLFKLIAFERRKKADFHCVDIGISRRSTLEFEIEIHLKAKTEIEFVCSHERNSHFGFTIYGNKAMMK